MPTITSTYLFEKSEKANTRWLLRACYGTPIENFPATYKRGEYKGQQYIEFRPTITPPRRGMKYFSHTFSIGTRPDGTNILFTGVNLSYDKNTCYGDSRNMGRNDAVLFEFSPLAIDNRRWLAVYFVENKGQEAFSVYHEWKHGIITYKPLSMLVKELGE